MAGPRSPSTQQSTGIYSMSPPVVLYRYPNSPFCSKIENALLFKNVPHFQVDVANAPPRPELADVLGITYRRLPILSIGRDVYCDTNLIVTALERHFTPSVQHPTLLPKVKISGHVDSGLAKALPLLAESGIITQAVTLVPWRDLPTPLVQDRSAFLGITINPEEIAASTGNALSSFASHLQQLEEQLNDGRQWLFNTETPGLIDLSLYGFFSWLQNLPAADGLVNSKEFPYVANWLARFSELLAKLESQRTTPVSLTGDQACDIIISSDFESLDNIGFDDREASLLGVQKCDFVLVAPTDTGKDHPTGGKLVALNRSEIVIEIICSKGMIRCHFPRLYFSVKLAKSTL